MKRLGRIIRAVMLAVPVVVGVRSVGVADQFQDATWAYEAGDYTTAINLWRPLAEQGNALAQMIIGIMYEDGQGLARDLVRAHMWLNLAGANGNKDARRSRDRIARQLTPAQVATAQKLAREWAKKYGQGVTSDNAETLRGRRQAAARGDAGAQFSLGVTYDMGEGRAQDYGTALKWYRQAAARGHAGAQRNLGAMYGKGKGVLQDHANAAKWFRKAAAQDDAAAQFNLGLMYGDGHGLAQDIVRAHMWLNLASANGNKAARRSRSRVATQMTPAQIAEAQIGAREWRAKHGQGVALHDAQAGKWLRNAAEQGDPGALFNLGIMYDMGHDVAQDHAEAVKWYGKAAVQGHVGAQYNLGVIYYLGHGVTQDYMEALKWFKIANVFSPAEASVGRIFSAGQMSPAQAAESQKLAREWMAKYGKK